MSVSRQSKYCLETRSRLQARRVSRLCITGDVCVCVCVCVNSERQGRSLQLQLEQTTAPHPGTSSSSSSTGSGGGGGRERTAGQTRQSRSKTQRRASPYHHQSRDTHLPVNYYTTSYDDARYYYDEYNACMMDSHDDRLISTASNSLLSYDYPLYCDEYLTSAQRPASSRDKSACAIHSSVIVRRQTRDTQTPWSNSCCKAVVGGYGGEDGVDADYVMVNGAGAGYTSVIVTMSGDTQ